MFDVHEELIEEKLVVRDARLHVPEGPGLGITLIEEAVRAGKLEGEPYWA
jgi:L-alanine-DL-glutamate epimerase-like enolase superfamily enzyme